ncbi:hypothetical protein PMAYCL1PPCAC_11219, partial [Pristionchus mayeri]
TFRIGDLSCEDRHLANVVSCAYRAGTSERIFSDNRRIYRAVANLRLPNDFSNAHSILLSEYISSHIDRMG